MNARRKVAFPALRLFALLLALCVSPAIAQTTFQPDQKVEVREGDEWSNATVVQREGRKYEIRYDDGTTEWVKSDRVRAPENGKPAPAASSSTSASPAGADSKSRQSDSPEKGPRFKPGDRVKILWGGRWWDGKVLDYRNGQVHVDYDGWKGWDEWKPPADVRFPHEPDTRTTGGGRAGPSRTVDVDDPNRPLTASDISTARDLQLSAPEGRFIPDPMPSSRISDDEVIALRAPLSGGKLKFSAVRHGWEKAFVQFSPVSSYGGNTPHIEGIDLVKGESFGTWPLMHETRMAQVRNDGLVLAIQSDGIHWGMKSRIDLYSLKSDPKYQVGFIPYAHIEERNRDITWIGFIENKYLATAGGGWPQATLVVWELPACRAVWSLSLPHNSTPAVSPGGKQIALTASNQIAIMEGATGKIVASFLHNEGNGPVKFSPDGTRLMLTASSGICIFEIDSGNLIARLTSTPNDRAQWVDRDHVTLGGVLYSVEHGLPLWKYNAAASGFVMHGGVAFYTPQHSSSVISVRLPTAEALQAEEEISDSHFMLRTGDKVSLDVRAQGLEAEVRQALVEKLQQLGFSVGGNAPVTVRATIAPGATRQVNYVHTSGAFWFGPFSQQGPVTTRTVTDLIYTLEVVDASGAVGWSNTTTQGAPSSYSITGPNDTLDAAFQRAVAPKAGWFKSAIFPAQVPKAEFISGFGETYLGQDGPVVVDSR